jgi:hypothetical protein
MEAFPFTTDDWSRVSEACRAVLNATLAGDDGKRAAHLYELHGLMTELREKYGDHPVLLETEADFLDDQIDRRKLYESSIEIARHGGLLSYTARIALARLLLEDFNDRKSAREQLIACESEVVANADEDESHEWSELLAKCGGNS